LRTVAFALLLFALVAGPGAPTAAAEQLHSTVISWSPNDVQPREPVFVVLQLYTAGPSPYPKDGHPVAGVKDVYVVIRGEEQTRRFATEDLGSGRYHTEIVFPTAGGWDLRVRYGAGGYGPGDEIPLGKGGICVGGDVCVGGQTTRSAPIHGDARPWTAIALAVGAALAVALVAAAASRLSYAKTTVTRVKPSARNMLSSRSRVFSSARTSRPEPSPAAARSFPSASV
jgi:hypothetical protein